MDEDLNVRSVSVNSRADDKPSSGRSTSVGENVGENVGESVGPGVGSCWLSLLLLLSLLSHAIVQYVGYDLTISAQGTLSNPSHQLSGI